MYLKSISVVFCPVPFYIPRLLLSLPGLYKLEGYVGPRLVIPGVHWMGGMLDLPHRFIHISTDTGYIQNEH